MRGGALAVVSVVLVGCGGPTAQGPAMAPGGPRASDAARLSAGPAGAAGGELDPAAMPARSVEPQGDRLVIWGLAEVPAGSRLQAALALVDAVTRAELAKYVEVRLATFELEVSAATGAESTLQVRHRSVEVARTKLGPSAPLKHGWRRLSRDGGDVLQLVGRLEISRAAFGAALAAALAPTETSHADVLLDQLFAP